MATDKQPVVSKNAPKTSGHTGDAIRKKGTETMNYSREVVEKVKEMRKD